MRVSRRWTEKDLQGLDERKYGFVHLAPIPMSPEAAALALAKRRAVHRKLEALFAQHLVWTRMRPVFETQVKFHPARKWTFDFYAAAYKVACELHGGTHSEGRHVRGTGFRDDRIKINTAQEMGITVLEFTSEMLNDGSAIAQTERLLLARGWEKP